MGKLKPLKICESRGNDLDGHYMRIANSCFPKKEKHLVTFHSLVSKILIDILRIIIEDNGLPKYCMVIPSVFVQHKIFVIDLLIKTVMRKKVGMIILRSNKVS